MPEANKKKKDEMMVDIDTSGPEAEVIYQKKRKTK